MRRLARNLSRIAFVVAPPVPCRRSRSKGCRRRCRAARAQMTRDRSVRIMAALIGLFAALLGDLFCGTTGVPAWAASAGFFAGPVRGMACASRAGSNHALLDASVAPRQPPKRRARPTRTRRWPDGWRSSNDAWRASSERPVPAADPRQPWPVIEGVGRPGAASPSWYHRARGAGGDPLLRDGPAPGASRASPTRPPYERTPSSASR